jgi:hypothetical protein
MAPKKSDSAIAILTLLLKPTRYAKVAARSSNLGKALHRDRRFDRWMRVVADQFEIFEFEIVNVFYRGIQFHPWQRSTFP